MKYILYKDFSYFIHNRKFILFLIWLVPLLTVFLYLPSNTTTLYVLQVGLGSILEIQFENILLLLMYLFNVFSFIYFIIELFSNDFDEYLENIFLRIDATTYLRKKTLSFLILYFGVKIIQYAFLLTVELVLASSGSLDWNILLLFVSDFIYILFLQTIVLLVYFVYLLSKKKMSLLVVLALLLGLLIPKNVWNLRHDLIVLSLIVLLIYSVIYLLFRKNVKCLMENV